MIKATVKGRRLELDVPADWPDGTEVEIYLSGWEAIADRDALSPQDILDTLAAMDRVEAFDLSAAELSAWEVARQKRTLEEKAHFAEQAAQLRGMWE